MNSAVKIKPEMLAKDEMDEELLASLRFLLLELRTISPFFGVLATEMWIAGPSKNLKTIGVSERGVISYNEDFMRTLTPGQRVAVFVHEALHVALDYWDRFRGRNWSLANKAHDFAINDIIVKGMSELKVVRKGGKEVFSLGVRLPAGGLWDPKYDKMSGEEIYDELHKQIMARTKEIREQINAINSDPVAKAAHERQKKINQALRHSLVEAAKRVGEKEAGAGVGVADLSAEIAKANRAFDEMLRHAEKVTLTETRAEHNREANNPYNQEDKPQAESGEKGEKGGSEKSSPDQQPGDTSSDAQNPEENPIQKAKEKLKSSMREAVKDYMEDEKDRIEQEVDGKESQGNDNEPDSKGNSHEENLENLDKKLDEIKDDYIKEMTSAKEAGHSEPEDLESQSLKDELGADQGQHSDPQAGNESDPNNSGENVEAGEGGAQNPGQGSGQSGQPGQGGEMGGNDSQESSASADGSGSGSGTGKGQGQGQGQANGSAGPVSPEQAAQDVYDALKGLMDEMSNSLGGKENGMEGLDKEMASGKDVVEADAFEQAMRELNDELGTSGMDGDVDMDCSEIPGNPYSKETMDELNNRRMQMLQRAVVEDMQAGGKGVGALPGWMKTEIEGILNPPMSFHEEMEKFFGPYGAKSKRSFSARNKRNTFQANNTIRPGMRSNTSIVYILMDTSGSMGNGQDLDNLRYALGLVEQMAQGMQMEVRVIQADTGITRVLTTAEAMEEINNNRFELHGLGGSDFTSSFEYIWREIVVANGNRGNPIVVFTDGAIRVPEEPPMGVRQQTLWVTCQGQTPPTQKWGDHIVMRDL